MAKQSLKCSKCGRKFALPHHLGRHMTAMHGAGKTKAKKKVSRRGKRRIKKGGRPKGVATSFGLRDITLERLSDLISSALREGRRRVAEFKKNLT